LSIGEKNGDLLWRGAKSTGTKHLSHPKAHERENRPRATVQFRPRCLKKNSFAKGTRAVRDRKSGSASIRRRKGGGEHRQRSRASSAPSERASVVGIRQRKSSRDEEARVRRLGGKKVCPPLRLPLKGSGGSAGRNSRMLPGSFKKNREPKTRSQPEVPFVPLLAKRKRGGGAGRERKTARQPAFP